MINFIGPLLGLTALAAWITHIVICVQASAWMLMVAGALMFPIAIVHGIASWLGFTWV